MAFVAGGSGCSHASASNPNFMLVIDDYATIPVEDQLELALDDSAGVLTSTVPDDGTGTFRGELPPGGSAVLVIAVPGASRFAYVLDWVAPPIPTIHTTVFGTPIPTATPVEAADATTWSVSLSSVPLTDMVTIMGPCGSETVMGFPVNTAGILVHDTHCASPDPSMLVAVALGASNRALAWGAATQLTPSPGNTVPVQIPLTGAFGSITESVVGFPSCSVGTGIITPDGIDLGMDSTGGSGLVTVRTFAGLAGTTRLVTNSLTTNGVEFLSEVSPIPSSYSFDQSDFPAFGPVTVTAVGSDTLVSWNLGAPFGFVGYVLTEWGPQTDDVLFGAVLPPDRSELTIPELPPDVSPPPTAGFVDYAYVDFLEGDGLSYADGVEAPFLGLPPTLDTYRLVRGETQ